VISASPVHHCQYCGGYTVNDSRGQCSACGGPRNASAAYVQRVNVVVTPELLADSVVSEVVIRNMLAGVFTGEMSYAGKEPMPISTDIDIRVARY